MNWPTTFPGTQRLARARTAPSDRLGMVFQPSMNVALLDGYSITNPIAHLGAWRDLQIVRTEIDDEVLRHVVADRVEQLGRDQLHR